MTAVMAEQVTVVRRGKTLVLSDGINPDVTVRIGGRRASVPTRRPDGTVGLRRPRNDEERNLVSDNQTVRALLADPGFWAAAAHLPGNAPGHLSRIGRPVQMPAWGLYLVSCVAGYLGSQRAAIAYFADPVMWDVIRLWAQPHTRAGWAVLPAKPPTRAMLRTFLNKWDSPDWADTRVRVEKAQMGAAMTEAKRHGHFDPRQPLVYNRVDFRQWVTTDGTVLKAPSDHSPDEDEIHRTDTASGLHSKGGSTARGSKFVLIETISEEYRGRFILAAAHVSPKPGNQQGDEAAPTVTSLLGLKQAAPGLHGVVSDTVLRGNHIKTLARLGLLTVNIPPAAENPERKTKGRNGKKRVERTQFLRTHEHTLPNGHICQHRLHTVGSVLHQEGYDDEGNTILVPLPNATTGYDRPNADGSTRWYVEYPVPCRYGTTTAAIRIDAPGRNDSKGWSWTDLMRFYPVGTPQYGLLYGRRNATESVHRQYKRKASRVPAYGATRQMLFVIGYIATHNAVARAFHLRRDGKPNPLDGTLRT
ncbi:MAG: hypothetical protein M9886_07560 [Candidatus Nanopelagicales bacterium]|nr:hypothetical protein [Candidatus Nanopelagicales bacterium]